MIKIKIVLGLGICLYAINLFAEITNDDWVRVYDHQVLDIYTITDTSKNKESPLSLNEVIVVLNPQINNKDSKIAEFSKEAARLEMDIRKYEHYPKVDLVVSKTQNYTNDLVAHKYDNKAMVQVSVPLYQGGYTKSRVQEATLLFNAASENLNAVNTQILDQFEDLWTQREALLESISVLESAKHSAKMYLLGVQQGEKEGTKSQVDILEAETKFQSMKSELAITFYELLLNELNLLALTGDLSLTKMQQIETMFF